TLRCCCHRLSVKRVCHPPSATAIDRERRAAVDDAVAISSAKGGKSRVKIRIRDGRFENGDGRRLHMEIQGVAQRLGGALLGDVEMNYWAQGMHAGVSAPGRDSGRDRAAEGADGFLERLLNGESIVLALPPDVRTSIIFEPQSETIHASI